MARRRPLASIRARLESVAYELGFPKPRPRLLDKRDQQADVRATDRRENDKVKTRSTGRCEVREVLGTRGGTLRCERRASEIHHLLGGIGRRNRGPSILAAHKLHICGQCHREVTGHVLKPINADEAQWALRVKYERIV